MKKPLISLPTILIHYSTFSSLSSKLYWLTIFMPDSAIKIYYCKSVFMDFFVLLVLHFLIINGFFAFMFLAFCNSSVFIQNTRSFIFYCPLFYCSEFFSNLCEFLETRCFLVLAQVYNYFINFSRILSDFICNFLHCVPITQ